MTTTILLSRYLLESPSLYNELARIFFLVVIGFCIVLGKEAIPFLHCPKGRQTGITPVLSNPVSTKAKAGEKPQEVCGRWGNRGAGEGE